ncbi:hypothetical protein P7B04_23120 [Sphingobium yanoikuyae]|uniref:hypothetical protein n=2 Tax=Sphingobium yanoikuyae TaxID=13690 RepID=UPI000846BE9F|nr:hypothetical protein [Sphingobium yanoikuyae]MDG2515568.1 hypothetical protein [Sphingobium yanoikuyae]
MTPAHQIAEKLTEAQRDIMIGHLVDIPPHEAAELEELGLKEPAYFDNPESASRRLIYPITPLGLAVRAILLSKETEHD